MLRLAKFWSLTRREKKFLCEASIFLSLSNTCVKTIAFKHIDKFLRTRWNDGIRGGIDREQEIRLVQRSISRAANVLPWKSLCLSRSIAEFIMLRRRGIPAVMFAGVRFSSHSSLDAHAWVETGLVNDKIHENSRFATLIKIGTGAVDQCLPSINSVRHFLFRREPE
jgi:hypothetical protein